MSHLSEAMAHGARLRPACDVMGLSPRTVQRWQAAESNDDMRLGTKTKPANALSEAERQRVVNLANNAEFRDLPPKQIVPRLADKGVHVASESTFERVLRAEGQKTHRGPKKRKNMAKPRAKTASAPGQVWTWDITLLRAPIVGNFFYLYMTVDIWSRKIVAATVHQRECSQLAKVFMCDAIGREMPGTALTVHQDNGAPMKGTLKACMENLGVAMSYSRPRVSNDNPYSESLFGTMKTRPQYPRKPFESIESAQQWVDQFTHWYNDCHRHSAIGYVTPSQRHSGEATQLLAARRQLYLEAKLRTPKRWTRATRSWTAPSSVHLNPDRPTQARMQN